jgi:hypothetical protein
MSSKTSAGAMKLAGGLCALIASSGSASALEDQRFYDLMVSVVGMQTPHVTEDSKDPAGVTTSYEWHGMKEFGAVGSLSLLTGKLSHSRKWGFEWGGDLVAQRYDITPTHFDVDGVTYVNNSSHDLRYYMAGANVAFGVQYGITESDDIHGFVELVPFVGAGINHANSDLNIAGTSTESSAYGTYFQYGARFGAYVTERNWLAGVVLAYQGSTGSVEVDEVAGYSSELTIEQTSFGVGVVLGYRF